MKKVFIELETHCGWSFEPTAQKAQEMSKGNEPQLVKFNFNGIDCFVSPTTDIALLFRDYYNAFSLEKKEIGPDCDVVVSPKDQAIMDKYNAKRQREQDKQSKERNERNDAQKRIAEEIISKNPFKSSDVAAWSKELENPEIDGYARGIINFADKWARIMQHYRNEGDTMKVCMEKAENHLDYLGISGNMYGWAVNLLVAHWKHGSELRVIHNAEYGHTGVGVVNPAVLVSKS